MRGGVETAELIWDVTTAAAMRGRSCEEMVREAGKRGSWLAEERGFVKERGTSCKVRRGRSAWPVHSFVLIARQFKFSSASSAIPAHIPAKSISNLHAISLSLSHSLPSVSLLRGQLNRERLIRLFQTREP